MLRKVGEVLLDRSSAHAPPLTRWLTASDAFDQSDQATSQAMYEASHAAVVLGLALKPCGRFLVKVAADVATGSASGTGVFAPTAVLMLLMPILFGSAILLKLSKSNLASVSWLLALLSAPCSACSSLFFAKWLSKLTYSML